MAQSSKHTTRTEQNREKWRQLIAGWEQSDLNQVKFCKKHGLDTSQFAYYRKVLASKPHQPAKMLPIEIEPKLQSKQSPVESLTLYLANEIKLKIPLPCDTHVLQSIFTAARNV